jgi:hypothetical protein
MTPLRFVGWVLTGLAVIIVLGLLLVPADVDGYGCGSVLAPIQQPGLAPYEVAMECEDVRAGRFLWALFVGVAGFALMVGLIVDRVRGASTAADVPGRR